MLVNTNMKQVLSGTSLNSPYNYRDMTTEAALGGCNRF